MKANENKVDHITNAQKDKASRFSGSTTTPLIDPMDIGNFIENGHSLSAEEKYRVLQNCWQPHHGFVFPKENGTGRRFNAKWLTEFTWLRYSHKFDGAFCLPCVRFLFRFVFCSVVLSFLPFSGFSIKDSCA